MGSQHRTRPIAALAALAGLVLAAGGGAVAGLRSVPPASQASASAGPPAKAPYPLVVDTASGPIKGAAAEGVHEFLGVPFAAPPVGPLRWKLPQQPQPWTTVRPATTAASICPQDLFPSAGNSDDEDCLYLNVYAPPPSARAAKPVMIWFHGGSFVSGGSTQYDPSVLAARGDVVVVTANYRMGPFGFLALPALDAESPDHTSGDLGLADQQAAMRWAQANAARFGGDGRDVTVFGQSSGGESVCDALVSPPAAGLFQRAIAESGCLGAMPDHRHALAVGEGFAAKMGCGDQAAALACLRAKAPHDLLVAAAESYDNTTWGPSVDGVFLPEDPGTAIAAGHLAHVPVLQGTNHDEGRLFVALTYLVGGQPSATDYTTMVNQDYGTAATQVLTRYPLSAFPAPAPAYAEAAVMTDSYFSCPALTADQALAEDTKVFAYEFDDPDAQPVLPFTLIIPQGAAHTSEVPYVLGRTVPGGALPKFTPKQAALSDQMIGYWTRFAATGDPNGPGLPAWPSFDGGGGGGRIQNLAPDGSGPMASFAADHQCAFWQTLPLPSQ